VFLDLFPHDRAYSVQKEESQDVESSGPQLPHDPEVAKQEDEKHGVEERILLHVVLHVQIAHKGIETSNKDVHLFNN